VKRRYVLAAVAAVAVGVPAAVQGCSGGPGPDAASCAALASWWKADGAGTLSALTAGVGALVPLDASSWAPLASAAAAAPGYPAGFKAPSGSPASAFAGNWAVFLQDDLVGAQLQNADMLASGSAALKRAAANLKSCGVN
jgi:hypothetical protein